MSRKPHKTGENAIIEEPTLLIELKKELRGKNQGEIAGEAGISPNTLNLLVKKGKGFIAGTRRKRLGQVQSLTKLATRLGIENIRGALAEFGIEANADVETAIARAVREATAPQIISDRTLQAIRTRGEVRFGLLEWPPFHGDEMSMFAGDYARRLVGNIGPYWKFEPKDLNSINECIKRLVGTDPLDDKALDAVFGLYETPFRYEQELNFVQIPGFRVQLGAIATSPERANWWEAIYGLKRSSRPLALTIEREVGELFLRGPLRYPKGLLLPPQQKADEVELATSLAAAINHPDNKDVDVVFVAERQMCRRVSRELQAKPLKRRATLVEIGKESRVAIPSYDVGIAVRGDAQRWQALIEQSQKDLFRNCGDCLAEDYAEVLKKENTDLLWSWERFETGTPDGFRRAEGFQKKVEALCPMGVKVTGTGWELGTSESLERKVERLIELVEAQQRKKKSGDKDESA